MLDGGLVVGYLTAFLLRGARRLADRAFESGLDRLADVVESRIGRRSLDRLEENPAMPTSRRRSAGGSSRPRESTLPSRAS
jgi:hypothetical protein